MSIPPNLTSVIRTGDCVAFVGAGFSAPAAPAWGSLLTGLAAGSPVSDQVKRLVEHGRSRDYEAAAQIVRDSLGPEEFALAIRDQFDESALDERMHRRIDLLRGIPFRAVLTTNFDGFLGGTSPGRESYLDVLRPSGHRWWDSRYWDGDSTGPRVVHLHGSVENARDLVFTRQDYRRRLYTSSGYATFLRSVMATASVLYLGFSFTDAYLDELRSEVLALLEYRGGDRPIAYALLADATPDEIEYSREHEGIEILGYSSDEDFKEFDEFLGEIHGATNPTRLLGQLLHGKRIVWIDPDSHSVDYGLKFLEEAAVGAEGATELSRFDDAESALQSVERRGADLVVTRWGHGSRSRSRVAVAEHVLGEVRARDLRVPVVVFASDTFADENKLVALSMGATSFEFEWQGLFQEIERIVAPGSQSAEHVRW